MIIAVLADDELKGEFLEKGVPDKVEIVWADSIQSLRIIEAEAYFDLLFENDKERIARLKFLLPKPVFVNEVVFTVEDFIRINAWPTMLKRNITEVSTSSENQKKFILAILDQLGWSYQIVPDIPGMITPRIISMIINEAWYSLGENVSTREEIDTAMKLGTNYPYGPFEWGDKIGLGRIKTLLGELQKTDARYTIAPGLNGDFIWH